MRYTSLSKRSEAVVGAGKTLNVSSSGVLFTSEHELPNGTRLQVFMHWPVKLNEK
ncbi:MAG: hypothetical protein JO033_00300, partial [Acidobacteriaceae bacterium]|nr:hypothetical protein [Acidobacteriaceae bacterium]